jgi:hypothetical protein
VRDGVLTCHILDTYLSGGKLLYIGHWGAASSCYYLSDSISHWGSSILEGSGSDPSGRGVYFALAYWIVHIGRPGPLGAPGGKSLSSI